MDAEQSVLTCTGRAVDDRGAARGAACGKMLARLTWVDGQHETDAHYEQRARVSGWKLGPVRPDGTRDVMCKACGQPDPAVLASIREIEGSIR